MAEHEANVCDTLDEAAGGDIPPQFATIVGSRLDDEIATVWLLTNDRPPFEPEEVSSQRRNERGTGPVAQEDSVSELPRTSSPKGIVAAGPGSVRPGAELRPRGSGRVLRSAGATPADRQGAPSDQGRRHRSNLPATVLDLDLCGREPFGP
jgi:hypothetical protein